MSAIASPTIPVRARRRARSTVEPATNTGEHLRPVARVYAALARFWKLNPPAGSSFKTLGSPEAAITPTVASWLDEMDSRFDASQLRQFFQSTDLGTEENLRVLIQRILKKSKKSAADRDKADFLLVQYLFCCASDQMVRRSITRADVAGMLQPVLGSVAGKAPAFLSLLDDLLAAMETCDSLGSLIEEGCIERGRQLKESVADGYYEPAALIAFARFNFRLRRVFFRFTQAEVQAARSALAELERLEVACVDCRTAGLSAEEPVAELRRICEAWQKPFRAPYSAGRPFDQIIAIRSAIQRAVEESRCPAVQEPVMVPPATPPASLAATVIEFVAEPAPADSAGGHHASDPQERSPFVSPVREPAFTEKDFAAIPASQPGPSMTATVNTLDIAQDELTACVAKIAQQIRAVKGGLDSSTASVVYNGVRLLLHSWEGEAFRKDGDECTQALQRAVAARAILTAAVDVYGRSGHAATLAAAIALADNSAGQLQEAAARARNEKQIETAVNLSASSKRLVASVGKARKLLSPSAGRS